MILMGIFNDGLDELIHYTDIAQLIYYILIKHVILTTNITIYKFLLQYYIDIRDYPVHRLADGCHKCYLSYRMAPGLHIVLRHINLQL